MGKGPGQGKGQGQGGQLPPMEQQTHKTNRFTRHGNAKGSPGQNTLPNTQQDTQALREAARAIAIKSDGKLTTEQALHILEKKKVGVKASHNEFEANFSFGKMGKTFF